MALTEEIKAQKNIELRKRIYRAIQSMYGLFRGSAVDIQIVDRYLNILKPMGDNVQDVVLFPYTSKKGTLAEKKVAKHCLFALVTETVRLWHSHCRGSECAEALEERLSKIELIVKSKLALPVRGCDATGYYFKIPKGE